jgi:hypothetical protein
MNSKITFALLALSAYALCGCGQKADETFTGSVQTPGAALTDDSAHPSESTSNAAHLSLDPMPGIKADSPLVSSLSNDSRKLRATVRVLDAATTSKLTQSSATQLTFTGAIAMSTGTVFVLKGVAYKAIEVVRSRGLVLVAVESPNANELFESFDRRLPGAKAPPSSP